MCWLIDLKSFTAKTNPSTRIATGIKNKLLSA